MNITLVADGLHLERSCLAYILLSSLASKDFIYFIAVPEDRELILDWAKIRDTFNVEFFPISTRDLKNKRGVLYQILNKIAALQHFPVNITTLCDSDPFFNRRLSLEFLQRGVTCASPAFNPLYGKPSGEFWQRLFRHFDLEPLSIIIRFGSNKYAPPYFNSGFVFYPNAQHFGELWLQASREINMFSWVEKKFPYLDQIALPVAISLESSRKAVDLNNVLPVQYNCNILSYVSADEIDRHAVLCHHREHFSILRAIFPKKFSECFAAYPGYSDAIVALAAAEWKKLARNSAKSAS